MFGIEQLTREVGELSTRTSWLDLRVGKLEKNLTEAISKLTTQLENLNTNLRLMMGPPNPVGPFVGVYVSQVPMEESEGVAMFIYRLNLPQLPDVPNAKDAVRGEVHLRFDDQTQPVINTTIGQVSVEPVKIALGVAVTGRFLFADAAGNLSANAVELEPFTVTDLTAPPDPVGNFGFEQIGQDDSEPEVGGGEVGGAVTPNP